MECQLSAAIENEFEIEIPDDEAEKIGLFSHKSSNSSYNTNSSADKPWLVSMLEGFASLSSSSISNPSDWYNPPNLTVRELLDYIYQKINDTTKTE